MTNKIDIRRFDTPDDVLDMKDAGGIKIIGMKSTRATGMHAIFKPGWTWVKDEKPLLGHPDTCPLHHTGYSLFGTLIVRMVESGVEMKIKRGDFFEIPPGHDAFVEGGEQVELILFAPPQHSH